MLVIRTISRGFRQYYAGTHCGMTLRDWEDVHLRTKAGSVWIGLVRNCILYILFACRLSPSPKISMLPLRSWSLCPPACVYSLCEICLHGCLFSEHPHMWARISVPSSYKHYGIHFCNSGLNFQNARARQHLILSDIRSTQKTVSHDYWGLQRKCDSLISIPLMKSETLEIENCISVWSMPARINVLTPHMLGVIDKGDGATTKHCLTFGFPIH